MRLRLGGTNSALADWTGVNRLSRSRRDSWDCVNGWPWPNGVRSTRAQMPRRLGTTTSSRPLPASTRQTSRSIGRSCSVHSTAWTSITRSIEKSASGSSASSARVTRLGWSRGQCSTPCDARHHGDDALGLLVEHLQIRRRVAEPEQAEAAQIGPHHACAPADHAARDLAQAGAVEIAQIDDIGKHRRGV